MTHVPHFAYVAASASAFARQYGATVRALLANGNRVSVACPPGDGLDELELDGIERGDVPLASGEGLAGAWRDALTAPTLVARWTEAPPDVVHATSLRALPAVSAASRTTRVPFRIATLDLPPVEVGEALVPVPARLAALSPERVARVRERAARPFVTRAARGFDRLLALHQGLEAAWAPLGADRIVRLDAGYGVAIDPWLTEDPREVVQREARARLGWTRERFVWVTCPLACDPGVARRLEAIGDAVSRALPAVRIAVVPASARHGETLRRALGSSVFVHTAPGDRRDALFASDAVLQAEGRGAFARSVMEGGLARSPAIVSDIDAHRAVVRTGANGMRVELDDIEAYVRAVRGLVDDPVAREEAGARARSYAVRLFDADLVATRLLDLYDEAFRAKVGEPLHLTADGLLASASELERRGR